MIVKITSNNVSTVEAIAVNWQYPARWKKKKRNQIKNEHQTTQHREANRKYNKIAREAVKIVTAQQPPKTELTLQHDIRHSILTPCILAHLNNMAELRSFNKHLNHLLKKITYLLLLQMTMHHHIKYLILHLYSEP